MLTPSLQSRFVTKILTSASGEQFRVLFLVTLINGEVKAQVISAEPLIKKNIFNNSSIAYLPEVYKKTLFSFTYISPLKSIFSPFNSLFFFNSQPTRAPAFC